MQSFGRTRNLGSSGSSHCLASKLFEIYLRLTRSLPAAKAHITYKMVKSTSLNGNKTLKEWHFWSVWPWKSLWQDQAIENIMVPVLVHQTSWIFAYMRYFTDNGARLALWYKAFSTVATYSLRMTLIPQEICIKISVVSFTRGSVRQIYGSILLQRV